MLLASSSSTYDVAVVGGGPAGSTVAALVARQGHRVIVLEREHFPRHQIGESLLPSTVHGICHLIGVREELMQAGFVRKRGGTFLWGNSPTPWTFTFSRFANSPTGFAYQVERAKFDQILLDNARRKGAEVIEGCEVLNVDLSQAENRTVEYRHEAHGGGTIKARFVVDAAGHSSQLYRHLGQRVHSKLFKNVALFGYYRNGKRLPEPNAGNILTVAFPQGWFWYIPLAADLTSVGVVVNHESAAIFRTDREVAINNLIKSCPLIDRYLKDADRITDGPYGQLRIRKDYSYCNTRFIKDNVMLIGDAACFVDPVLSSGVHLATYGALLAARTINTVLARSIDSDLCFREFEYRYRREFGNFYQFLAAFYDMHRDEKSYYWEARRVLNASEEDIDAFRHLVAGVGQRDEAVFDHLRGRQAKKSLGEWFGANFPEEGFIRNQDPVTRDPVEVSGFDFDGFMPGISDEIAQIQVQALMGESREPEGALRVCGLIPSLDGVHWTYPG